VTAKPTILSALDPESLGELAALQGVVKFPVRIKCATLSWNTLAQTLDEVSAQAQAGTGRPERAGRERRIARSSAGRGIEGTGPGHGRCRRSGRLTARWECDGVAGTVVVGGIVTGLPYASSRCRQRVARLCAEELGDRLLGGRLLDHLYVSAADEYAPVVGIVAVLKAGTGESVVLLGQVEQVGSPEWFWSTVTSWTTDPRNAFSVRGL